MATTIYNAIDTLAAEIHESVHVDFPVDIPLFVISEDLVATTFSTRTLVARRHVVSMFLEKTLEQQRVRIFKERVLETSFRILLLDWTEEIRERAIIGYITFTRTEGVFTVSDYRMSLARGHIPEILRDGVVLMLGTRFAEDKVPIRVLIYSFFPQYRTRDEIRVVRLSHRLTRIFADRHLTQRPSAQVKKGPTKVSQQIQAGDFRNLVEGPTMLTQVPPTVHEAQRCSTSMNFETGADLDSEEENQPTLTVEPSPTHQANRVPLALASRHRHLRALSLANLPPGTIPNTPNTPPRQHQIYPHGQAIDVYPPLRSGYLWRDIYGNYAIRHCRHKLVPRGEPETVEETQESVESPSVPEPSAPRGGYYGFDCNFPPEFYRRCTEAAIELMNRGTLTQNAGDAIANIVDGVHLIDTAAGETIRAHEAKTHCATCDITVDDVEEHNIEYHRSNDRAAQEGGDDKKDDDYVVESDSD